MRLRNKLFRVWLTDEEYLHLETQADKAGMKRSQFLRALIMEQKIQAKPQDMYLKLIREINAIGNNINQIARIANAQREIKNERMTEVVKYLDEIMEKVRDIG